MERLKIHIIGVCGTAMAGVAVLTKELGFEVSGSDSLFFPPMSEQLKRYGIRAYQFDKENIKDADIVIVGNSVSRDNIEVQEAEALGKKKMSYPEVINEFFGDKTFFVVSGTHGKTTSTACLSYFLHRAGFSPSFLVGGVPLNFGVSAKKGDGDIFVIEGDEYDTAFFDKRPKFWLFKTSRAVIGPVEFDHADIYLDFDHYKSAFCKFAQGVKDKISFLASKTNFEIISHATAEKVSFIVNETEGFANEVEDFSEADFIAYQIKRKDIGFLFKIKKNKIKKKNNTILPYEFKINLLGKHNVQNALSVMSLINDLISWDKLSEFLPEFRGVAKRLEVIFSSDKIYVIDDFAHHPTEIIAGIRSLREFFGRVIVAFEPRSFTSRTNIHLDGFKEAFELADAVFIGKIYREEKIPPERRLKPEEIVEHLRKKGKTSEYHPDVSEKLIDFLVGSGIIGKDRNEKFKTAVVFMSSGDFYGEKMKFLLKLTKYINADAGAPSEQEI